MNKEFILMKKRRYSMYYILEDRKPVPCPDYAKFCKWYISSANKGVGYTKLSPNVAVSTIFLGTLTFIESRPADEKKPSFFETIIIYNNNIIYRKGVSTWEEAEQCHNEAVRKAEERMEQC